jgi:hypothetical protein
MLTLLLLVLCFRKGAGTSLRAENTRSVYATAEEANALASRLLGDYAEVLDRASQSEISAAAGEYGQATGLIWRTDATRTALTSEQARENLEKADRLMQSSPQRMTAGIERIPGLIRLSGQAPVSVAHAVSIPFHSAVLVVHRRVSANELPEFLWKKVDLASGKTIGVDLGNASDFIGALELMNPPPSSGQFQLQLTAGGKRVATLDLSVTVPPQFSLQVEIRDGAGQPTEAAVGLYAPAKKFLVPAEALDFSAGGLGTRTFTTREPTTRPTGAWPSGRRQRTLKWATSYEWAMPAKPTMSSTPSAMPDATCTARALLSPVRRTRVAA